MIIINKFKKNKTEILKNQRIKNLKKSFVKDNNEIIITYIFQ